MIWRKAAKRIAYWTIPPGIENLIRARLLSGISTCLTPEEKELLEKNRSLRNRHLGERCFILATGPSIRKQNLKLLQGEICIAVSNFFVHPDYHLICPQYYCIAPHHSPITEEAWQAWIRTLNEGIGNTCVFFSLSDRVRNQVVFRQKQVYYLKFDGMWEPLLTKNLDITQPLPSPQSVTIMALFIALYMGFRTIYLLGCDHDWILHLNTSSHFYDENRHALNRHGYNEWFGVDFESYCQDYIRLWRQYKAICQIASSQSTQIYNATDGGLLDVFPRVKFKSLFEQEDHESFSKH